MTVTVGLAVVHFLIRRLFSHQKVIDNDSDCWSCSGAFSFDDVRAASTNKVQQYICDLQKKIQFDEPVNIQFTSVSLIFQRLNLYFPIF